MIEDQKASYNFSAERSGNATLSTMRTGRSCIYPPCCGGGTQQRLIDGSHAAGGVSARKGAPCGDITHECEKHGLGLSKSALIDCPRGLFLRHIGALGHFHLDGMDIA